MVIPRNAEPLTKYRRGGTDGKRVLVSIKVRRSDRLIRVFLEFIPILIENCHNNIARQRGRRWQLGLRSLVKNYRQVILQVEPRSARPNDCKVRRICRKQRSRNEVILEFQSDRAETRKDSYLMREGVAWKGKIRLKSPLERRLRL